MEGCQYLTADLETDANYDIINLHRFYVVMAAFLIKVLIGNCVCIAL